MHLWLTSGVLPGRRHAGNGRSVRGTLLHQHADGLLARAAVDDRALPVGRPSTQHATKVPEGGVAHRGGNVVLFVFLSVAFVESCVVELDAVFLTARQQARDGSAEPPAVGAGQRQSRRLQLAASVLVGRAVHVVVALARCCRDETQGGRKEVSTESVLIREWVTTHRKCLMARCKRPGWSAFPKD